MPDSPPQTEEGRVQSIGEQIAAARDSILADVQKMIDAAGTGSPQHAAAQEHTERHLDRPAAAEEGLEAMVDRALGKVLGERDAASAEDQHRKQHEALAAATAEKLPVERARRHRFMGWGEPA